MCYVQSIQKSTYQIFMGSKLLVFTRAWLSANCLNSFAFFPNFWNCLTSMTDPDQFLEIVGRHLGVKFDRLSLCLGCSLVGSSKYLRSIAVRFDSFYRSAVCSTAIIFEGAELWDAYYDDDDDDELNLMKYVANDFFRFFGFAKGSWLRNWELFDFRSGKT